MKMQRLCVLEVTTIVVFLQFATALAQTTFWIKEEEVEEVNLAINETQEYLTILLPDRDDFGEVLDSFNKTSSPWVYGLKSFCNIMLLFEAWEEDTALPLRDKLYDLNEELEKAKYQMIPAVEAIQWDEVNIDFNAIVTEIQKLDGKLWEILFTNIRDHAVAEYTLYYENNYMDAGRRLYDIIVRHDGYYRYNILDAAMYYNQNYRRPVTNFMKGLMVLSLRAAAIELAYERCWEHDRGMDKIWEDRLRKIWEIMLVKDNFLELTWIGFKPEVDQYAKDNAGLSDSQWCSLTFKYLNERYYWRVWYVQSWEANQTSIIGFESAKLHWRFDYFGRNLAVVTEDWNVPFDAATAQADIVDRRCPNADAQCFNPGYETMFNLVPNHGAMKLVIDARWGYFACSFLERRAAGQAFLIGSGRTDNYWVVYAG